MLTRSIIIFGLVASLAGIGFLTSQTVLEIEIRQALIAGLVVVSGWLVTFLVQEWNRANERKSRQLDIQLALRAEIQNSYLIFSDRDRDTAAFGREVQQKIISGGKGNTAFHPFIAQDASMIVFEALRSQIQFLPPRVIDEVIQFYCQLADLQAFARQMSQPDFRALVAERRADAYDHYIQMIIECQDRAMDALTQLNYSLGVYDDDLAISRAARRQSELDGARKSLWRWINKTGQDQSGRSTDEVL